MPKLELRLFGGIEIHADAKPVKGLVSRKADALIAYLACNPALHPRERLADLLWDDRNPATAMGNLRVLLNSIRGQLAPPVIITRNTVHLDLSEEVWVDSLVFESLVKPLTQVSTKHLPLTATVVEQLHRALTLYQGEFLAGFYLREAQQFEDWVLLERERYHISAVNAAHALVCHYNEIKQYGPGIAAVQRWLQFDFFNETAHRFLMELLTREGQQAVALDHYQRYVAKLTSEGLAPSITIETLYQQIANDALHAQAELLQVAEMQQGRTGAESAQSIVPHNLPSALTPLIGRTAELTTIQERLHDQHCRLLTIVGLGGVGKTRLAIEAAQQLAAIEQTQPLFRDGLFLVRLDRLEPDQLMPSVIANAINFTFQGALDQQTQLFHYLRGRHMLLLLDNFEHLLHQSDFVDELLQYAPHVKVLVTSRERLEFMGEWLLAIEGLPCPPNEQSEPLRIESQNRTTQTNRAPTAWHDYPAPQLFIHTAKTLQPNFTAAQQKAAIIEICETLEGLPLGIQLAAAAVHVHSCTEIATAIRRNLDFVNTKMRNMPERHRSLRAVFEHSWHLLTPEEQRAFGNLAVFVDGFSAETVQRVADVSHELLAQLRDKSLIQQMELSAEAHPDQPYRRYRLHPVLHHYASAQLAQAPAQEEQLFRRHCLYFGQFIADLEAPLNQMGAGTAADAIAVELENIRASWRYALAHRFDELLLVMLPAVVRFYLLRGYLQDALTMLGTAITDVTASLDPVTLDPTALDPATFDLAKAEQQQHDGPAPQKRRQTLLANLFVYSAEIRMELGDYDEAALAAQQAIAHAKKSGDAVAEALGHLHWGVALNYLADYRQAKRQLQRALELTQHHALTAIEALAQRHIGVNSFYQGDYTGGRLQHESAIRYYQQTENLFQELRSYHSLAMLYFYTGDYLQARRHYERCRDVYQEIGDRPSLALTLNNLGAISTQLGDYTNARHAFEEALDIRRRIGDRQMEGLILANLGLLMHLMNNHRQAVDYCTQALEVSLEIGERDTEAYTRACLAHAQLELGQIGDAIANYELAVGLRKNAGQQTQMLEPVAGLARVYLRLHEPQQALRYVEEILEHLRPDTNAGIVELIRLYLTCYRVLYLVQDPRAKELLTMGQATLQERAARIIDNEMRQLYLENIVAHRELLTEYETQLR